MPDNAMLDRFRGCLLGLACGDAAFAGNSRDEILSGARTGLSAPNVQAIARGDYAKKSDAGGRVLRRRRPSGGVEIAACDGRGNRRAGAKPVLALRIENAGPAGALIGA
jgi:hypothetical protein